MSELSSRYARVIVASESTYGTDAVNTILTTATADIVYQDLRNLEINPMRTVVEINRVRGSHSGVAHKTLADHCTVSCEIPLSGWISGDAGEEAPYYNAFLKAMNLKETVVSATSATYNPATVAQNGLTIYAYEVNLEDNNSRLTYCTGVRGNGTLNFALGEEAFISFEGMGIYQSEISAPAAFFNASTGAAALLKNGSTAVTARSGGGTEVYANKAPIICTGMTFEVGGTTYDIKSLDLGLNWTTTPKSIINASSNVRKVLLTRGEGSRIGGSFELLDGDQISDMITKMSADTEATMSIVLVEGDGSTGSATITISLPKIQLGPPTKGDDSGMRTYSVPFFANGTWTSLPADNDFTIVYGEVT